MLRPILSLLGAAGLLLGCSPNPPEISLQESAQVHARVLTLDTHLDTPMMLMRPGFDFLARHDPLRDMSQADLPRILEGGLDAAFWAVYVSQGELTAAGSKRAVEQADKIFARIHQLVERYPEYLALATTATEVRATAAAGKHAVLIGVENGFALGGDIERVWRFRDLGARYIGLIHSKNNDLGDSSTDSQGALHGGLSEFGRRVVREMNRAGLMVDVSHAGDQTVWDILEVTQAPPIASHSSARAVYNHPRNLTDDMLRAIAGRGGVVQVNTLSSYIAKLTNTPERQAALDELRESLRAAQGSQRSGPESFWLGMGGINAKYPPPLATVADVADHIDHMVHIMGIDHVGVGADFDGGGGVEGMFDVSQIGNLTRELLDRGYAEEDIAKIWGGNLLRVMTQVEALAAPPQAKRGEDKTYGG